jgi:formylglycine-generating enzyme required for sulfatase activity
MMGSPKNEPGRIGLEQLPHEVAIDEGFWMFDTPCTQALWQALMGENPSEFKSPDRPVERVSWDDCAKFVEEIKKKVGLVLALPSEAQWEYACRAGTTTATYAGPLELKGAHNAPSLDPIAWYGGNSGVDFDLSDGFDASSWPEKQYPFDKAGTHPVATKRANPWGLYDMLGNVWEWCQDAWVDGRTQGAGAAETPSARRVIRGGSWSDDVVRYVRAAFRDLLEPSCRTLNVGFRCAEFREGRELSGGSRGSAAKEVRSTP